jgi:hypothetical protein
MQINLLYVESWNKVTTMLEETSRVSAGRRALGSAVVMDNFLCGLNNDGYYTAGYTDDIVILNNGKFYHTVSEVLQHLCAQFDSAVTEQIYP